MSTVDLRAIAKICHSESGVKAITLTARENISLATGAPVAIDPAKVYSIVFSRNSGSYKERSNNSAAGTKIDQSLKLFVPKKRLDVEYIIQQMLSNKVTAIYTDWNGEGNVLLSAKMNYEYATGQRKTDSNGYSFEFTAATLKKYKDLSGIGVQLPAGTDPETGDEIGTTDGGQAGGNTTPPYYVVINPTPLGSVPPATGNTTNLNQLVTGSDGNNYFIDYEGRALELRKFPKFKEVFTDAGGDFTGNTITVTETLPASNDDYIVLFDGVQIQHTAGAVDTKTFNRSGQTLSFYRLTERTKIVIIW